jgi:serine/threonine protein phosphatase PrpC
MPHIMESITIAADAKFLILASDGLWNVMGDRVVEVVQELKNKGRREIERERERGEGRERER